MLVSKKLWRRLVVLAVIGGAVAATAGRAAAAGAPAGRTVIYRGYHVHVPGNWPIYHLSANSHICVRFDRHAVYVGRPGSTQICPPRPAGRTEAILLAPASANADRTLAAPAVAGADAPGGTVARVTDAARGVVVTATWRTDPAVVARALGVRSLGALAAATRVRPALDRAALMHVTRAHAATAGSATAGQVYTGTGFDVCSTPSAGVMSAWSGAYRAAAVYIGGANMACAQSNLTGSWVSTVTAAGWHLIPIYVGLQAPRNSCGCAAISPGAAASQGVAAANDAIAQAQARGVGPGNPIYFDMEAYTRNATNSSAVLTFLSAWTQQLHAAGYLSGVYSSDNSGIADLVASLGTGRTEPDAIWNANWNGVASTYDASVPSGDWASHQRVHQYRGGHNETHGGVTLNIDGDYIDAPTAGSGAAQIAAAPPQNTRAPAIAGPAVAGQMLTEVRGGWSGVPSSYSVQWETCDGAGNNCTAVPGATGSSFQVPGASVGHTVRVVEVAGNAIGTGSPASSAASTPVQTPPGGGYWLFSARGNVFQSANMAWYGSAARSGIRSFTGAAATSDGQGYWLVDAAGTVFSFGDATSFGALGHRYPIAGIVAARSGGYWLYTAHGNVYNTPGTAWYGSASRARTSTITGMAATADGRGYWLVNAAGRVFAFGDAATEPAPTHRYAIRGIVASPNGGYWLYTAHGNVYNTRGAGWFGSAVRTGDTAITGLVPTADGNGYWLTDSAGRVFAYGDAPRLAVSHRYTITGIGR